MKKQDRERIIKDIDKSLDSMEKKWKEINNSDKDSTSRSFEYSFIIGYLRGTLKGIKHQLGGK